MGSKITIRELAGELNISPAALSFILNHKPGVSDATRSRVIEQLKAMGYDYLIKKEPEPVTPAVAAASGEQIGFLIYRSHGKLVGQENPYFLTLMESIETEAGRQGARIVLTSMDSSLSNAEKMSTISSMNLKGLLIFGTEMSDSDCKEFSQLDIPVVVIDNEFSHINVSSVSIDNTLGTFQAVEYLYNLGHRDIGYLKCSAPIQSFEERAEGYRKAFNSFGLEFREENVFSLPMNEMESYQLFSQIIKSGRPLPTAFVSDDDLISVGVMQALNAAGIQVPEDISLVGFNDRPVCATVKPGLSTISIPHEEIGSMAMKILSIQIAQADNDLRVSRNYKLRIGTYLKKRDSAAKRNG